MFRKRPSKGHHKKHAAEPPTLQQKPSRVIRLHYYESPEAEEQQSSCAFEGRTSTSTSQSIYEEQSVSEEPLFHEPFLYTQPSPECVPHQLHEEDEDEATEQESIVDDCEESDSEPEEEEQDTDEAEEEQVSQTPLLTQDWALPVIKVNDMFEHYLDNEEDISIYSIHEPTIATVVPILAYCKPRVVNIPPVAGRKRKTQYDSPSRQHSRNSSNTSDNSSQYSSNDSSTHSDNESTGPWDESPLSSLSPTPTATSPSSPTGAFPKRARTYTNPYSRPMSGTFPKLDQLARQHTDEIAKNKPFRRSVARGGAATADGRPTSMVLPGYAEHDDIDEMLEKADRAMRRREWQSSSSVWYR